MKTKTKAILGAVARHALAAGGVYLAAQGVPPEALTEARQLIHALGDPATSSGAATTLGVLGWSIWQKVRAARH